MRDATAGKPRLLSLVASVSAGLPHFALYAGVMFATILARAYRYGDKDHYYYFPFFRRIFDDTFLRNDWFAQRDITGPHGYLYAWLQGGLGELISWPAAALLIFLVTWFLAFDASFRIGKAISGRRDLGYVAAILLMLVLDTALLSKNAYSGQAIPRELSRSIAMYGLYFWLSGRWRASALALAGATYVHILTGGEFSAILIGAVLLHAALTRRWPEGLGKGLGLWAALVAPYAALAVLWLSADATIPGYDMGRWATIVAWIRCPHHYTPSRMPLESYTMQISELALAAWAWFLLRRSSDGARSDAWRRLGLVAISTLVAMVGYWLCAEVFRIYQAIRFEAFLNSFWLRVVGAFGMAALLTQATERLRGKPSIVALAATLSYLAGVWVFVVWQTLRGRNPFPMPWHVTYMGPIVWTSLTVGVHCASCVPRRLIDRVTRPPVGHIMGVAVALALAAGFVLWLSWLGGASTVIIPGSWHRWVRVLRPIHFTGLALALIAASWPEIVAACLRRPVIASILPTTLLAGVPAIGVIDQVSPITSFPNLHHIVRVLGPAPSENDMTIAWLGGNTPRDAVILTPPMLDGVRTHSDRAIVVSYRSLPFDMEGTLQWFERYSAVVNDTSPAEEWTRFGWHTGNPDSLYSELSTDQVVSVARRYGASYVVRSISSAPLALPVVHTNRVHRIYQILPKRSQRA